MKPVGVVRGETRDKITKNDGQSPENEDDFGAVEPPDTLHKADMGKRCSYPSGQVPICPLTLHEAPARWCVRPVATSPDASNPPLSHSPHHARLTKVSETRSTSSSAGRTASCPSHHASTTAPLLPSANKVLLGREDRTAKQRWCLESLTGRFVEIMGIDVLPALSPVAVLLREAQRKGEPVAWISGTRSCFYPPDLAKHGIDLAALPVVQAPDLNKAYRAADTLLRSGGFGVVVFDLCLSSDGGGDRELSSAMQVRLSSLARENTCTLLCLIRRPASRVELGSLASLRTVCRIKRIGFNRFRWRLEATKDKQSQPGWSHEEICHGAEGMC